MRTQANKTQETTKPDLKEAKKHFDSVSQHFGITGGIPVIRDNSGSGSSTVSAKKGPVMKKAQQKGSAELHEKHVSAHEIELEYLKDSAQSQDEVLRKSTPHDQFMDLDELDVIQQ